MGRKTALITGVSGQDGSYLAELLLERGYEVMGTTRDPQRRFGLNIAHLEGRLKLANTGYDIASVSEILRTFKPTEVYNFAGQTFVNKSWELLTETVDASAVLPMNILEAIVRTDRSIRFVQASTCEIFSLGTERIFSETSPMMPGNPYGCAKAFSQNMVSCYRRNYGLFAASAILFHHESPRRAEQFVSRKIVKQAVAIKLGHANGLTLGDTSIARDWSYAPDLVTAMAAMMQVEIPEDLILSSGETHSLAEMTELSFAQLGLDYRDYLTIDPSFFRAWELPVFGGDSRRARQVLNWVPRKNFRTMLESMINFEMRLQTGSAANFAEERPFT